MLQSAWFVILGIWIGAPNECYHVDIGFISLIPQDILKDCWKTDVAIWFLYLGIVEGIFCSSIILFKKIKNQ